jgi:hypothetical protein
MIKGKSLNSEERVKKRRKRGDCLKRFGIHADQYEAILKDQNNVCAICKKPDPCGRDLAVDHCHITNKVRGLLCTNCNMAIGKFQENIEYLRSAVDYMARDYQVPDVPDTHEEILHTDRPNWKLFVTTPEGRFPSMGHAAKHYKVHETTIRHWCMPDSKWKRDGFSCEKMFISLNELKEYIDGKVALH